MTHANMPLKDALAQLIAECKQLDASEVGERWNQFNGAIAVADMVLRDWKPEPVAWAVTTDGRFTQNLAIHEDVAKGVKKRMDEQYPSHVRKVVPLYAEPVAAQPAAAPASVPPLDLGKIPRYMWAAPGMLPTILFGQSWVKFEDIQKLAAAPLHESGSAAAPKPLGYVSVHDLRKLEVPGNSRLVAICSVPMLPDVTEAVYLAAPAIAAPTEVERDAYEKGYAKANADWCVMFDTNCHYRERVFNDILEKDAEEGLRRFIRTHAKTCDLPPEGWHCTRVAGHTGPCTAHQNPAIDAAIATGEKK